MSEHYHDAADLRLMKDMKKLAPADFDAWLGLDKIVGRDGAIPRKYRELMAIAVACTTQCPYCIEAHAKDDAFFWKPSALLKRIAETGETFNSLSSSRRKPGPPE